MRLLLHLEHRLLIAYLLNPRLRPLIAVPLFLLRRIL